MSGYEIKLHPESVTPVVIWLNGDQRFILLPGQTIKLPIK